MKKRILEQALSDLNSRVQAKNNAIADLRAKAYEVPEISDAQALYSKAKFDAIAKGAQQGEKERIRCLP